MKTLFSSYCSSAISIVHPQPTESQLSTPSPKSKPIKKQRFSSSSASTEESPSADSSLDRTTTGVEPAAVVKVWDQFHDGHSAKSSSLREGICLPLRSESKKILRPFSSRCVISILGNCVEFFFHSAFPREQEGKNNCKFTEPIHSGSQPALQT